MKVKYNKTAFAYSIIGLAILTYIIIRLVKPYNDDVFINELFSDISTTVTINVFIWSLFCKWFWKWRIFYDWLVPFPDLSGNWNCELKPNCNERKFDSIPAKIKIKQSFFNILIEIKTNESSSISVSESFDIDKDRGYQRLVYSYVNTPKMNVRKGSPMHYGTAILEFDGFYVEEMEGQYWTDRETTGVVSLKREE